MLDETRLVLWNQGLFLQPQHFQASDLADDAKLRSLRRMSSPWAWGFYSLELSAGGLQNNQIDVTSLHAVFQDGTEVAAPGNAVVASRSFANAWTQPDRPFTAYLGLRRHDPNGGNVTHTDESAMGAARDKADYAFTRYLSPYDAPPAADAHGDGPAEPVRSLHYSLRIFWESEIGDMADCDFLPLAQLVRLGENIVQDPNFVPPPLKLGAFPLIKNVTHDIRNQLLGRAANLEEYKPAGGRPEQWLGDPKAFGMLLTLVLLNRNIPALDFAVETDAAEPWRVYLHIRQLVADLSSVVTGINAQGENDRGEKLLPPYNHANCGPCFNAARNLILTLLSRVASGPEHIIRLEPEGGFLVAQPPDAFFAPELKHYLMVRGPGSPEAIRAEALRFGKLCPMNLMRDIINQALPGVEIRPLDHAPTGLPRRNDTAFFEINRASPLWMNLQTALDKTVAFTWDGGGENVVVHLAAMR